MNLLETELEANYRSFREDWTQQATKNWNDLAKEKHYLESYRRLCCLQALKVQLIEPHCSPDSSAFFLEAHNDAVASHVSASMGAWRPALQSLRSCLENTLSTIYYKDHPIELQLWQAGKFRKGFSELMRYAQQHPIVSSSDAKITGLELIESEYATLSKAVHASATIFRMTDVASKILIWSTESDRLGMWATRERKVIEGISLLLVCLFADRLQGTLLPQLRDILSYAVTPAKRKLLKKEFNISISKS
ncbi:hypothetical protein [Methylocystis rosea]|uniref:Uncharacterized protein n=1 Tax=Methylocystis rosea TaxID=173366 RepID=A0A3G8M5B3_9HYPH|nr:hypothetical protein [Methylocystis rosea]AZG77061.1 hypothetical protein EHO51_10130 [Methylocystis rosea]